MSKIALPPAIKRLRSNAIANLVSSLLWLVVAAAAFALGHMYADAEVIVGMLYSGLVLGASILAAARAMSRWHANLAAYRAARSDYIRFTRHFTKENA